MSFLKQHKFSTCQVVLFVYGVLMAVLYGLHPFLCDDVIFRDLMTPFLEHPSVSTFLSCAADRISTTWLYDNGRITQIISPVLITAPRWLTGLPIALCVVLSIYYSARIAGVWERHPAIFGLLVFMWTVMMPWPDFMFCVVHAYNYLPPLCLSLWLLYRYTEGSLKPGAAFWMSLLTACWHELYGAMLFGASAGMAIFFKAYRSRTSLNILLGALLGIAYLALVPGTAVRAASFGLPGLAQPTAVLYYAIPVVGFLLLFAVARFLPRVWLQLSLPKLCCLTFAAMPCLVIWRLVLMGPRLTWPLMALSAIGICYILAAMASSRLRRLSLAVGTTLVIVSLLQLGLCIPWFARMAHDVECADTMPRNADGNIFYDLTDPDDAPFYILGKPNFVSYKAWAPNYRYVLPTALKDFTTADAAQTCVIDGTEAYLYKGLIVFDGSISDEKLIRVDFDGIALVVNGMPRTFTAADGRLYTYMYINKPLKLSGRPLRAIGAPE